MLTISHFLPPAALSLFPFSRVFRRVYKKPLPPFSLLTMYNFNKRGGVLVLYRELLIVNLKKAAFFIVFECFLMFFECFLMFLSFF